MEVTDERLLWSIRYALQQSPLGIESVYNRVTLAHAYETGVPNFYRVLLDMSNQLSLHGLMWVEGELSQVWLDSISTMTLVRVMIQDALTEYNSTANWRMRGM